MARTKKHLALRIAALKASIRRKYRQFKDGTVESERLLEKQYKPLLKELKQSKNVIDGIKTEQKSHIKQEAVSEERDEEEDDYGEQREDISYDGGFVPEAVSSPSQETEKGDDELSAIMSTQEGLHTASQYVKEHFENPLTQEYMMELMKDAGGKSRKIDHDYGPRIEGSVLMIGDKTLNFDADGTIIAGGTRYRPTVGLYELLFKRLPNEDKYTNSDLETYKSILITTNAHKRQYNFQNPIKRDNSLKYRHVIKNLFPTKIGKGMMWKNAKSRDLSHWDDPNELVDRLRLLVMSAETGNNSHRNEILNIVEELREAGYIKGRGNSRFNSLLQ